MIDFREVLTRDCTRRNVEARSMKAALERGSELLAARQAGIDPRRLLQGLLSRERLGSTGMGEGVALPHCRFKECRTPMAAALTTSPVDFDAPDGKAVDIVVLLAVPQHGQRAHLELLGALARVFDDAGNLAALRRAETSGELYETLQWQLALAQRE